MTRGQKRFINFIMMVSISIAIAIRAHAEEVLITHEDGVKILAAVKTISKGECVKIAVKEGKTCFRLTELRLNDETGTLKKK